MALRELVRDKDDSDGGKKELSLSRSIALATFAVLSAGFIFACYKRVTWEMFLAYPAGVTLAFVPQLFLRLVDGIKSTIVAWKGNQEGEGI